MRFSCPLAVLAALFFVVSCGRNERMDTLYAQRCLGCHGSVGKGDGPISPSLPVGIPDFRDTVQRKNVLQIRRAISDGSGMMPAFEPALSGAEIQDMVIMVRLLSREDRNLQWWEKFDSLVWAHCSVPWEYVLGYDEPPKESAR